MSDLNVVTLAGRLAKEPVLRKTGTGTPVANFTIKQRKQFGENEPVTHYYDIVMFGRMAEVVAEHFPKDKAIIIVGELQQERWEKDGAPRSKLSILARQFHFPPRDFNNADDDGDSGGNAPEGFSGDDGDTPF